MAQDNTLGAPTEGLGQNVTFVADGRTGVPQASAMQRGSFKVGARGGEAQRANQAVLGPAPKGNPLLDTLLRLGGEVIKPHVEAERNRKYLEGMQQAAQGQAITEIVDEQPWYSKVFGSTSLVDGARAYTASTAANAVAAEQEADMVNLRKLSANEMAMHSAKLMQKTANTGDTHTDNMIMQSMGQTLPVLMKTQAKEHLRYQQEQLSKRIGDNLDASASNLRAVDTNARNPDTTADGNDVLIAGVRLSEALKRPPEIAKEEFDKAIVERATAQIMSGNFALHDALEGSGFTAGLTPTQQHNLRVARNQATIDARANLPIEFLKKESQWRSLSTDPGNVPANIEDMRKEVQAEYERITGDKRQYLSSSATVQELEQLAATKAREQERLRREAATANAPAERVAAENTLLQGWVRDTQQGSSMRDLSPAEQRKTWKVLNAVSSPADLQRIRAEQMNGGIYDTELRDRMRIAVNSALQTNDPVKLEAAYQQYWMPLVKDSGDMGDSIALDYAGKEVGEVLNRYHKIANGTPADPITIGERYSYAALPQPKQLTLGPNTRDSEELSTITKNSWKRSWYAVKRVGGSDTYAVENPTALLGWIKGSMNEAIEDADLRVDMAIKHTPNLTVAGGYAWIKSAKATSVTDYLTTKVPRSKYAPTGGSNGNVNTVVREHVDMLKNYLGIESEMRVWQADDAQGGNPRMAIMGLDAKGAIKRWSFTAQDMAESYAKRKAEADKPTKLQYGPEITYRAPDDMPSPSAGDEAWKAYRQRQAAGKANK